MCQIIDYWIEINGQNKGKATTILAGQELKVKATVSISESEGSCMYGRWNEIRLDALISPFSSSLLGSDVHVYGAGTHTLETLSSGGFSTTTNISITNIDVSGYPNNITCTIPTSTISRSGTNLIITSPNTQWWKVWGFSKLYHGGHGAVPNYPQYPYFYMWNQQDNGSKVIPLPITADDSYRADLVDFNTNSLLAYIEFTIGTQPITPVTTPSTSEIPPISTVLVPPQCVTLKQVAVEKVLNYMDGGVTTKAEAIAAVTAYNNCVASFSPVTQTPVTQTPVTQTPESEPEANIMLIGIVTLFGLGIVGYVILNK